MIRSLLILFLLSWPWTEGAATDKAPVLLVLGDSLSAAYGLDREAGWVSLLEARLGELSPEVRVVNASVSGETTAGGLSRLPALLDSHQPALVIIELGANDGLRGFEPALIRDRLAALIQAARAEGAEVLLLGVPLPPNYGAVYTQGFQAVFQELAATHGVALVPDILAGIAENRQLMQADGLHPSAEAQPRLLANLWPRLAPLLHAALNVPIPLSTD